MGATRPTSPISLAVIISVMSALLVVFFVGAIAVGYALMTKHIDDLQAQQVRQGIPICRALKELADAKRGAVLFGGETNPNSYISHLSAGMTTLYQTTGCDKITGPLP